LRGAGTLAGGTCGIFSFTLGVLAAGADAAASTAFDFAGPSSSLAACGAVMRNFILAGLAAGSSPIGRPCLAQSRNSSNFSFEFQLILINLRVLKRNTQTFKNSASL
jgi:hypothetical protein